MAFLISFLRTDDLSKEKPHDLTAFTLVSEWMDECVRNLDQFTSEDLVEDIDFWKALTSLVQTLLHREYVPAFHYSFFVLLTSILAKHCCLNIAKTLGLHWRSSF